jgi:hypothetical protein
MNHRFQFMLCWIIATTLLQRAWHGALSATTNRAKPVPSANCCATSLT